jgi:hypothetical protein
MNTTDRAAWLSSLIPGDTVEVVVTDDRRADGVIVGKSRGVLTVAVDGRAVKLDRDGYRPGGVVFRITPVERGAALWNASRARLLAESRARFVATGRH